MSIRDYMSGPHDSDHCTCRHDGVHWLKRCAAATANDEAESKRWARDRIRRSDTEYNPEYLAWVAETGRDKPNEDLR